MILEATLLGTASTAGFGLTFNRLPSAVKQWLKDHPLLTDAVLTYLTYDVLGQTLTALMAAGFVSVFVSVLLYYLNYRDRKKEERIRSLRS